MSDNQEIIKTLSLNFAMNKKSHSEESIAPAPSINQTNTTLYNSFRMAEYSSVTPRYIEYSDVYGQFYLKG